MRKKSNKKIHFKLKGSKLILWSFAVYGVLSALYSLWQLGIWLIEHIQIDVI